MGKVRILLIKRVAKKMVEQYPDKFSKDFDQNKKSLEDLNLTRRLRNRIAGYISALMTPSKVPIQALGEEKPLLDEEVGQVLDQEGREVVERVQADEIPEEKPDIQGA
jgi:small subunit ribosomal protein S17e